MDPNIDIPIQFGTFMPALIKVISITDGPILELGIGLFSTPFLHFACYPQRHLVSYENDKKYYNWLSIFKRDYHEIHFVEDWNNIDLSGHWSVVLVDHEPTSRRKEEIKRLANSADYIVVHDTNPRLDKKYKYSEIYPLFKFRKDFNREKPYTTVLSNFKDLSELEEKNHQDNKHVAIFIPTYKRAHKLLQVYENAKNSSPFVSGVYLIVEADDLESIEVIKKYKLPFFINERSGNYAGAINTAYLKTSEKYFFNGADDLDFKPGWLEKCLEKMVDPIMVVGANDLVPHPTKSSEELGATHYLVDREYIKKHSGVFGENNLVLYEGYFHNYTDCELTEIAKLRQVFAYCPEAVVAHIHYKTGLSEIDDTYRKQFGHLKSDKELYRRRRQLFTEKIKAKQMI